jgi:hypothetical protein
MPRREAVADIGFLQRRASACREAASESTDQRESEDLLHLARIYDRQVKQLTSEPRRRQVQA